MCFSKTFIFKISSVFAVLTLCLSNQAVAQQNNRDNSGLQWREANLTYYESYPEKGSEECLNFSGCEWEGMFAAVDGKMSEFWVKNHKIISIHSKDFEKYKLKTFRITQGPKSIDAKVYDMCADSDCDGCCTENAGDVGFLIDMERYTAEKFGSKSGKVKWSCLDCAEGP